MAVAANNNRPIIDRNIIQHFMNNIRHGVIIALRVARRNQAKFIHKGHQARRIGLRLTVPNRGRVTARLISAIHGRR